MAELHVIVNPLESVGVRAKPEPCPEQATSQARGPAPVWRSLLSPSPGQRALVLGEPAAEILKLLRECGVHVERGISAPRPVGGRGFDFILEEVRGRGSSLRGAQAASLLSEGGRWMVALHGERVVGLKGRWILSQLRRRGFGNVERYYAHASLWSPEILVPLERHEPFDFFLRLTVGGGTLRRGVIHAAFHLLGRMGLHRDFLPNCILVARRSR